MTPKAMLIDNVRCIGCRYCQLACPFLVPKFQWNKAFPVISKCTMCADRLAVGLEPACAKVCPTDAVMFGDRDEMVVEAERRIRSNPNGYYHHVYGKDEAGGTCVLHLSSVPFELIGYKTDLPTRPLPDYTSAAMSANPKVMAGLTLLLGAIYGIIQRRRRLLSGTGDSEGQGG